MSQRCEFEVKLADFRENELPELEAEQLRSHLKSCIICQQMIAEIDSVVGALNSYERPEPPPELFREYADELDQLATSLAVKRQSRRLQIPTDFGLGVRWRSFAQLATAVIIGFLLGQNFSHNEGPLVQDPKENVSVNLTKSDLNVLIKYVTESDRLLQNVSSALNQNSLQSFNTQRAQAERLMLRSQIVENKSSAIPVSGLLELLQSLEILLLEIANSEIESETGISPEFDFNELREQTRKIIFELRRLSQNAQI